jgi:hypothetical protein
VLCPLPRPAQAGAHARDHLPGLRRQVPDVAPRCPAPQEITGPNEGPVQVEYRSFDEMRAYLLTMGIDYDRLPPPRMLERHQMIDVTKNGSTNN